MKSRDFKTSKLGVVNTNVRKKEGSLTTSTAHDVETYMDFIGQNHFNAGALDVKPDKEDLFKFTGVAFG